MKKIKVSEASGAALDWLVGTAQGYELSLYGVSPSIRARVPGLGVHAPWAPSRYCNQADPIIDRELIATSPVLGGTWNAYIANGTRWVPRNQSGVEVYSWEFKQTGSTRLIAALRCYVASKLGDEVEVPEELIG